METAPNKPPKCSRCDVEMVPGKVIAPGSVLGMPDFPGGYAPDLRGETISEGPGSLAPCMKCPECGRSVSFRPRTVPNAGPDHV